MMQPYLEGEIKFKIVKSEKARIAFDGLKNWIIGVQIIHLALSMQCGVLNWGIDIKKDDYLSTA